MKCNARPRAGHDTAERSHTMMRHVGIGLLAWLAAGVPAVAAGNDAASCAAGLKPKARQIYDTVAPGLKPGDDLRGAMTLHVMPMVMTASISRSDAQAAAPSAAVCLTLLQQTGVKVAQR
jgi:hypothetical protein